MIWHNFRDREKEKLGVDRTIITKLVRSGSQDWLKSRACVLGRAVARG